MYQIVAVTRDEHRMEILARDWRSLADIISYLLEPNASIARYVVHAFGGAILTPMGQGLGDCAKWTDHLYPQ